MKRTLASLLVAASLLASGARAQPILYGATAGGEGSDSSLYTIDPATGTATLVGLITGPVEVRRCSSLEASAEGILYAVCERSSDDVWVLVTIDRATAAATVIGVLGVQNGTVTDISFASDGTLFGYVRSDGDFLVTIDTTTGAATAVGPTGIDGSGSGLGFVGATLFYAGGDDLSTLDVTDGSGSLSCVLGYPVDDERPRINGMDQNPLTGVLFGSYNRDFAQQPALPQKGPVFARNNLVTIDTTTCAVTVIGPTADNLDAIAWLVPPDLAITKTDSPDPVVAGSNLTYTITVENLGLAAATNVVVTDTLPAEVTLVSSDGCDEDPTGGDPTCTIASIPAEGSAQVTLVVSVSPLFSGTLVNTATIETSAANTIDSNDSATAETLVSVAPPSAIPTLSEWALAALVLLLTVTGVLFARRF